MTRPLVSVVVETITTRHDVGAASLADGLAATLGGVARQTYPGGRVESVVVLDREVAPEVAEEIGRRYPSAKLVSSLASNYFAAKNAGAAAAGGEVVALLDGDCEPAPDWLERLLARLEPGVAAVAGRTRYGGGSWAARTFSVPHFAYVVGEEGGEASGFNINNVAFPRAVLLAHPFEERIRRDGGCYLLFHQLRAGGARVLYEPRAAVAHELDLRGLGFLRKHFNRGYDGASVYRFDDRAVLRGTRLFRRLGAPALVAITARRILVDWRRIWRHRRQIGLPIFALPFYGGLTVVTRLVELAGGVASAAAALRGPGREAA